MKKNIAIVVIIVVVTIIGLLWVGCNNSSSPTTTPVNMVIDNPKGGETFLLGDAITISFRADGDSVSSVNLKVTSDNGIHYSKIAATSIPITGSGLKVYTQKWIIGKEVYDTTFRYLYKDTMFGSATNPIPTWKCHVKISSSNNEMIAVNSGDFNIQCKSHYFLRYPIGGEVFKITDTIPIIYTFRDDSTSIIQCHFWSLAIKYWSSILTYKEIPAQNDWHLKTAIRNFFPADTLNNLDPVGDSTKIMIVDYGQGSKMVESGWIRIQR